VREHINALSSIGGQATGIRRPRELDDVDALVIPGGESTTMDKLVRAFDLQEPLRKRIAGGMPVYGSCAGMIMLADRIADARPDQETLGGLDITVRRNAFGRQVDSFEGDLHIPAIAELTTAPQGYPSTFKAVFIRAPWVEEMGDGIEVLARVETGPAAGRVVAIRAGNLLATSFHPEVTGDHRIHEYFTQMVRAALR
jgi:5'-phosphate synthase pdxT subunit